MKRINIAFVCTDTDYAGAVAKALMCEDPGIQVMVAQNIPENKGEYDLIIISGMEEDPKNDDCIYLNGFVSLPEILWLIREKRPNHGPSEPFRSTSDNISQIVMVTGASGGCGVTSVSEALAEELTVYYDKKVCVLSFSLFPENTTGAII